MILVKEPIIAVLFFFYFIYILPTERLRRTDFFPGLGWMITRKVWDELKPKWPVAFWDDWMRHFDQRLDRACIQPEISRTYTFGERGASVGQYWKEHLQFIVLNKDYVAFDKMNSTWDLLQVKYFFVFFIF